MYQHGIKYITLWLTTLMMLFILPLTAHSFITKEQLFGQRSQEITLLAGSFFFHSRDFIDKEYKEEHRGDNFRNAHGLSAKGFVIYYFETSHRQDSLNLGIERTWYTNVNEKQKTLIGYRLGMNYGYCTSSINKFKFFERCNRDSKYHFSPMAQLFFNTSYNHIGFEFATAILMSNISLIYRF
jgi:hypothetical protein